MTTHQKKKNVNFKTVTETKKENFFFTLLQLLMLQRYKNEW